MLAALQKKDWKAFARLYNGPAYAQNRPTFSFPSSIRLQMTLTRPRGF